MDSADRIAFSLYQITAAAQIKSIQAAQAGLSIQIAKAQSLDTANMNLATPSTTLINEYQGEYNFIDGNIRTTVAEKNIQDAANKKLSNYFFPNNTSVPVPGLSSLGGVWPYIQPFALNYAIGQNYVQSYTTQMAELTNGLTTGYIALIQSYTPVVISPPSGTPVTTVKATVTAYKTLLTSEAAVIAGIVDPANTDNNTAAYNDIVSTLIPALNTYLASSGSSANLTALQTAVTSRNTFITTRVSQLNAILGTITQDLTNGNILTATGLYGQRYKDIALRLNGLSGSLTILAGLQNAYNAQSSIVASIQSNVATYFSMLPTTGLLASPNNTNMVQLISTSFVHVGDTVYVVADNQTELQRAVSAISGNMVTLNDVVPMKYSANVRLYEDLS